ncbi:hypothetical protein A5482_010950 [Cyanobacterium sp. IPPAS B-1200]|uniref:hypothetical protein n=1 Tax=Cyanobacterium sp. IPPAS B-1200 TaxID=1562720 RepID=UPI0008524D1E|nr:hypothetical protein [Cyanobacterium sp. IPPAS B-1200]OEJ80062.1 hypothetical protein A5482_07120 [Cyanobacterium sp. IPPAS B-1200]
MKKVLFPVTGAIAGSCIPSTMGGIGIVGSFGGIGLGLGSTAGLGFITGAALYGGIHGINTKDFSATVSTCVGILSGITTHQTIGNIGIAMGGNALGVGIGAMAFSGGILGLGIYGLARMFDNGKTCPESFTQTYSRIEDKVLCLEAYNEVMMEVDPTLAQLSWEHRWAEIEVDYELNDLKKKLGSKIDYVRLNKLKILKAKRDNLMNKLKQTFSSYQKFNLLQEIDNIEKQIKENSLFK